MDFWKASFSFTSLFQALTDSGEEAKVKGTRKGSEAWKRKFFSSRFIFLLALSKFRWPDYLGAWNRLLVHVGTKDVVEYDDIIYHIPLALRAHGLWGILSYFHHIFMSVFEWTGENDSKRYLSTRILRKRRKKSPFSKNCGSMWTGIQ